MTPLIRRRVGLLKNPFLLMIDALDKVLHHDDTKKKKKKKDNDPCERKTGSWVVISMGRIIASRSCLVVSYKKGKMF